jgi:septum formation protein
MARLILASRSPTRVMLLKNAGISFEAAPASVDERAIEAPLIADRHTPADIALALAAAKASAIGRTEPAAIVIGADQILEVDGTRWTKPGTIDEARRQLERLSGRTTLSMPGLPPRGTAKSPGAISTRHG